MFTLRKHKLSGYDNYTFGFLWRRDVILFMKRLRYYISSNHSKINKYGQKEFPLLRYFLVGEYGPKKLRPHYHALLFIDSEEVASKIPDYVSKSWQYGICDVQLSASGKSAHYCAGYVNSFSFCPEVLKLPWTKAFTLHSSHFGASPDEAYYQNIESLNYDTVSGRVFEIDGCFKQFAPSVSLQSALFPKCYRYGVSSDLLNLVRYRFYELLPREICGSTAEEIAKDYLKKRPLINGLSVEALFPDTDTPESTVKAAFYTSVRFLRLCNRFRCSPWYYYHRIIKPFYQDKELSCLNDSLRLMMEEVETGDVLPIYMMNHYSNVPRFEWNDMVRDMQRYGEFTTYGQDLRDAMRRLKVYARSIGVRPDILAWINVHYDDSPVWLADYMRNSRMYNENLKHKELNELNNVLYNY